MTTHLNDDQRIAYIHQTLTDAEREVIDQHLAGCLACRARLDEETALQRRMRYELAAAMRAISPSSQMNFTAIAPRVKRSRRLSMFIGRSNLILSSVVAIILVFGIGVGLYALVSDRAQPTPEVEEAVVQPTIIPTKSLEFPPTTTVSQPEADTTVEPDSIEQNATPVIDTSGGKLIWKFETGGKIDNRPAVDGEFIYFGSADRHFYAVDRQTGQEVWRFETNAAIGSWPVVADGRVYFGSNDGHLYALDSQTGQEQWRFKASLGIEGGVAIADGILYFGSADRYLYAVDARLGRERWRFLTEGAVSPLPAIVDETVYFSSDDGRVYAVDTRTGQERWRFEAETNISHYPLNMTEDTIYVGSLGYFYALNAQTGQIKWQFDAPEDLSAAGVGSEDIVYAQSSFHLFALDSQTGDVAWQVELSDPVTTVSNGLIYAATLSNGSLIELDGQTGQEIWRFEIGHSVGWPVIVDGVVYVGSSDSYFYAIKADPVSN